MIFTGPVSLALAKSLLLAVPDAVADGDADAVGVPLPPPPLPLVSAMETAAVIAMTAIRVTPPSAHFMPLPPFFGG
ncbi:hypothetical protein A5784_25260 [Mycobacterium sp. 852013-50091_SCH5140682]|nr:hypothetical protein A5784_25260 [Mycobacterium sp. 852013-50091_SCH5140682]